MKKKAWIILVVIAVILALAIINGKLKKANSEIEKNTL